MPVTADIYRDQDHPGRDDRDAEVLRLLRFAATVADPVQAGEDRERAVELLLGLAHGIAARYVRRGVNVDDLRQVAAVAVLLAVGRFDPARGEAFFGYVSVTIHGELKRYLRDHGWTVRPGRADHDRYHQIVAARHDLRQSLGAEPTIGDLADHLDIEPELVRAAGRFVTVHSGMSLDSMVADHPGMLEKYTRGVHTRDVIEDMTTIAALDRYLRDLGARDRLMVRMRFGLDMTQREIGEHFGLSQMHVSRVLSLALTRLREALAGTVYDPSC